VGCLWSWYLVHFLYLVTLLVRMWSGLILLYPIIQFTTARVRTSGRLLATPRVEKCEKRPKHYMDKRTGHYYFFSGKSHFGKYKASWLDARNICRSMCMDLISIETPEEDLMVERLMLKYNVNSLWTSGRLCNFHGCDAPHLQPKHINGWFWSGSGARMGPTNQTSPGWKINPWSHTGYLSQFVSHLVPQPDNAEYLIQKTGVTVEACMAVQNNWYNDGISWHDTACYRSKQFMCEDSDKMVNRVKNDHPNIVL